MIISGFSTVPAPTAPSAYAAAKVLSSNAVATFGGRSFNANIEPQTSSPLARKRDYASVSTDTKAIEVKGVSNKRAQRLTKKPNIKALTDKLGITLAKKCHQPKAKEAAPDTDADLSPLIPLPSKRAQKNKCEAEGIKAIAKALVTTSKLQPSVRNKSVRQVVAAKTMQNTETLETKAPKTETAKHTPQDVPTLTSPWRALLDISKERFLSEVNKVSTDRNANEVKVVSNKRTRELTEPDIKAPTRSQRTALAQKPLLAQAEEADSDTEADLPPLIPPLSKRARRDEREAEEIKATAEAVATTSKCQPSARKKSVGQVVEAKTMPNAVTLETKAAKIETTRHMLRNAQTPASFREALPDTSEEAFLSKMKRTKAKKLSSYKIAAELQTKRYITQMSSNGIAANVTVARINEVLGHGVFATKKFTTRDLIGYFAGEYIARANEDEANYHWDYELLPEISLTEKQRKKLAKPPEKAKTYRLCIDASETGNFTRFFNHSTKEANVSPLVVNYKGKLHCAFISSKPIKIGQQLLLNYGEKYVWPHTLEEITPSTFILTDGSVVRTT